MIALDTSALMKRYVDEPGTDIVRRAMHEDPAWAASSLARSEAQVSLCHRGPEGETGSRSQRDLAEDWDRFLAVPIDAACLALTAEIGCTHRVRTLDAIHLAAALRLPGPVSFLSFDRRQSEAAEALGLDVVTTDA